MQRGEIGVDGVAERHLTGGRRKAVSRFHAPTLSGIMGVIRYIGRRALGSDVGCYGERTSSRAL